MEPIRMVAAVTAPSAFQARVLVARLTAEGIVARTDANDGGPYPGGPVGVLVEEQRLDAALEVLGVFDDPDDRDGMSDRRHIEAVFGSSRHAIVWVTAAFVVALMIAGVMSAAVSMAP